MDSMKKGRPRNGPQSAEGFNLIKKKRDREASLVPDSGIVYSRIAQSFLGSEHGTSNSYLLHPHPPAKETLSLIAPAGVFCFHDLHSKDQLLDRGIT